MSFILYSDIKKSLFFNSQPIQNGITTISAKLIDAVDNTTNLLIKDNININKTQVNLNLKPTTIKQTAYSKLSDNFYSPYKIGILKNISKNDSTIDITTKNKGLQFNNIYTLFNK